MKKASLVALVCALVFTGVAAAQTYSASLTGAAEAPGPGDSDGSGLAVVTLSGTSVSYVIAANRIAAPTMAHIHRGAAGTAGPVVVDFTPTFIGLSASGTVNATQVIIDEIRSNPSGFYVNVHTADFSAGAIRGQLSVAANAEAYYFPIVGRADGLNNTRFVADVRVVNNSSGPAAVVLEFFPSSPTGLTGAGASRAVTVAPGAELVINDVVASQFSATGLGALKIGSSQAVVTGVRVFNDLRPVNGGTTGFFIRPKGISEAATSGTLLFLSQANTADIQAGLGFRTNLGWFNPNSGSIGATFQARRVSDGAVLGSVNVGINGLSQLQQAVFSLISSVAAADQAQTDFYVTWTATGPLYIYAAVVDNKTGDVVYVD